MAADQPRPERKKSREVRDLETQGRGTLTWGLPNPATEATVLGLALLTRERLDARHGAGRAVAAADLAAQVLDATTRRMPQAPSFTCTQGCNYCCHAVVPVSAPEVFRIANGLRATPHADVRMAPDQVAERCRARAEIPLAVLASRNNACPLLIDGDCGAYADRPLSCRQTFSLSVEACRKHSLGMRRDDTYVAAAATAGVMVRAALLSAVRAAGLPSDSYELGSALALALAVPDAEQRWLAGEDVLAGATKVTPPGQVQASVTRWSEMMTRLLA